MLKAPQLVVHTRMLYVVWTPADPDAAAALVPDSLTPAGQCFINQYECDSADQTSHFGAYSLTYMGVDLEGLELPDGTPGRWWTHYLNSSDDINAYGAQSGIPVGPGRTTLTTDGDVLTAVTESDGRPVVRTRAKVGSTNSFVGRGHLRYITEVDGAFVSGRYPFVAPFVDGFEVLDMEFLDPDHSSYALRPASPLDVSFAFYSPAASFAYPGGEEPLSR